MDPKHFDTLTKVVSGTSAPSTRRSVLQLLPTVSIAGALTALVAGLGERAAAHPVERVHKRRDHHRKRARRRQDQRHEQRTRDNGSNGGAGDPGAGDPDVCVDRGCPAGLQCCTFLGCRDLQNDPNNCGICGHLCLKPGETGYCVNGQCARA